MPKNYCVLCNRKIYKYNFIVYGNYCQRCNTACEKLSKLFPQKYPDTPTMPDILDKPITSHNKYRHECAQKRYEKKLCRFRAMVEKYDLKMTYYQQESNRFQETLKYEYDKQSRQITHP